MKAADRVLVALDVDSESDALKLASQVRDAGISGVKVGLELFHAAGPAIVGKLADRGFRVFLDLKYHDITATVERTARQAAGLGAWMFNVHALGGREMMTAAHTAAREAAARAGLDTPLVIGVTVLTNLTSHVLSHDLGISEPADELVVRLARLTLEAGLDGVVSSPHEVPTIKTACGAGFLTVTPGVRPVGADPGDQRRITTPAQALHLGSDYLVIGRPITRASDPVAAARRIVAEMEGANIDAIPHES